LHTPVSATARVAAAAATRKQTGGFAMTTKEKSLDPVIMDQFTGSEHWYRHGLVPSITFTDGAKYVADAAGAYWLLDEIALAQRYEKKVAAQEFQVWKLEVKPDSTAILICEDGNDNVVCTKQIPFTDFQAEGITLWFENNVIYLPSEH
jgi:hypothetical protein